MVDVGYGADYLYRLAGKVLENWHATTESLGDDLHLASVRIVDDSVIEFHVVGMGRDLVKSYDATAWGPLFSPEHAYDVDFMANELLTNYLTEP
ncbi:MAG: hypothetical protein ACTH2Y_13035 [Corynebacterium sp.]|uniref:hypothetical protein n=1 Tax=unclassified Corynebacterium TaxID=2624378 RepID=UPI002650A509|nr:hypothetical protein [Corynebacterium sp.]